MNRRWLLLSGILAVMLVSFYAVMDFQGGRQETEAGPHVNSMAAITPVASMEILDDERPLEHGDILAFRIVEDRSPPVSLIVSGSGEIEIPFIGKVHAEGKTPKQLAYELKEALEKEHYQTATIVLGLDWAGTRRKGVGGGVAGYKDRVNVWGAVNREGPVPIPPSGNLTIADAISAAGGFTPFAERTNVRVHRILSAQSVETTPETPGAVQKRPTDVITINVKNIVEKGDLIENIPLQPNDVIIVEQRIFEFFSSPPNS